MNNKVSALFKNFSYTLVSNFMVLIISSTVIFIMPKLLGVKEYSYFQLYILYTQYTALMHFGWNDGVYLRYGGEEYENLDKDLFFSQFLMLLLFELLVTLTIVFLAGVFIENMDKLLVMRMMVLCSLLVIPRGMILFILQGTNRIKEYSVATIIEKIVYISLIILFLLGGFRQYQLMLMADILGKLVSLIFVIIKCKDIVFRNLKKFEPNFYEAFENIRAGIKVAFAYVASILITGIVRLSIEDVWDIETFGKVSLTLSVSNLMMVFINAVGIILFPVLRRIDKNKLPSIYSTLNNILSVFILGVIVVYYPMRLTLSMWLPKYAESLKYMALIFPIFLYEGKMGLLLNTYLKALRKEKMLMIINLIALILSGCLMYAFAYKLHNLTLSVLSILILLAFRCIFTEIYLSKVLKVNISKDIFYEVSMICIFIWSSWIIGSWLGVGIYLIAYLIYLFLKQTDIKYTMKNIKVLIKK